MTLRRRHTKVQPEVRHKPAVDEAVMLARRTYRVAVASLIVGTVATSAEIVIAVAAWS
jgi:hypothetical protein